MSPLLLCLLNVLMPLSLVTAGDAGVVEKRIVNGGEALPASHPYIVSLQYLDPSVDGNDTDIRGLVIDREDDDYWTHFCGGVLIDTQWVLTAARCVEPDQYQTSRSRVKLGEHNLDKATHTELAMDISRVVVHPKYCKCAIVNDIALVKLQEPVRLGCNILTARMAEDIPSELVYKNCVLAGWGRDKAGRSWQSYVSRPVALQEVNITHIPNDLCASMTKRWLQDPKSSPQDFDPESVAVRRTNICAMDTSPDAVLGPSSACHGDSGGPMMCDQHQHSDHQKVLVGITSWGPITCDGKPNVYTRVSKYVSWIKDTMAKDTMGSL